MFFDFLEKIHDFILDKIRKNEKWLKRIILVLAFLSIGLVKYPDIADVWASALYILYVILFLPIFARVFGWPLAKVFMGWRKELGILMGMVAFAHVGNYFLLSWGLGSIATPEFWWMDSMITYTAAGFVSFTITMILLATSNSWSQKLLGRKWKLLHRSVYFLLCFIIAHVILIKGWKAGWIPWDELFLPLTYFFFKILEWSDIHISLSRWAPKPPTGAKKWQKYICVPCGYIYDPAIWDTDSGIASGIEFSDIPDSWRCPVCGVSKIDFIPYDEDHSCAIATLREKNYLNPTTLELIIETSEDVSVHPGQFAKIILEDHDGYFNRSYSVVRSSEKNLTFVIKLAWWRASRVLRELKEGSVIGFGGVFGNFILQETPKPKVFIATGTGLSPIINMLDHTPENVSKQVYFSVSTKDELFYEDVLRKSENTELLISVSREQIPGYLHGRIDLTQSFAPETEFYLCGNPAMIREKKDELLARGYQNIFTEAFL